MKRLAILIAVAAPLLAQRMPPSPAGYTEARQYRVEGRLTLPGTVICNVTSLVAGEIGGRVVECPVQEGDRVKKGQILAKLNTRAKELELGAMEAQLREAEARQKLAQRNFERTRELFASKVVAQQQLDDTHYEFNAWEGQVGNLRAEIERIRYDIERSTITAPFAGVIVVKHTEVGEWLGVGGEVVELISLDDLEVRVDVPERYFPSVRVGSRASLSFEALPGRKYRGKVTATIPQADEMARTLPIKIRLSATPPHIGVGMLAEVSLDGVSASQRGARNAIIVPKDAIVRRGARATVWVLAEDGSVNPVPVRTGMGVGEWIEVSGGLAAGAKVVTRGNERLRPGQKVQGEPVEYPLP